MYVDILAALGALTNVQPPKKGTTGHLMLVKFVEEQRGSRLACWLVDLIANGLGDCAVQAIESRERKIGQADKPSLTLPGVDVAEASLVGSEAVLHMLAAGEFWARTRVGGTTWAPAQDIPAGHVEFAPASTGKQWRIDLPTVKLADHVSSVEAVYDAVTTRTDEIRRIKAYASFPEYAFALALLDAGSNPRQYSDTLTLLDVVPAVVSVAIQRMKQVIHVPRADHAYWNPPSRFAPVIKMPAFTAYPGGHAAIGHALAAVLSEVTGGWPSELSTLADRIGADRELAGLHCRIDTEAGALIGKEMGRWLVEASQLPSEFPAWAVMCHRAKKEWQ